MDKIIKKERIGETETITILLNPENIEITFIPIPQFDDPNYKWDENSREIL